MLGSIPVVLSVAVAMKVRGVQGDLARVLPCVAFFRAGRQLIVTCPCLRLPCAAMQAVCLYSPRTGEMPSPCVCAQALHASYYPDGNVPIAWWLLAYGTIQLALSQIPTMHQLRHLNAAAVLMTATWTIMMSVECVQTGAHTQYNTLLSRWCTA
jgi:hypothetical protein